MSEFSMRVAFLLPTFPELSNTFILNQITGLLDRGHSVDLFAIGRRSFTDTHGDVARYDLATRMRHLPIPQNRWARVRSALQVVLGDRPFHPAKLDALNPGRHGQEACNLTYVHTAGSFLRAGPYDILHCQFGHLGPLAERLVRLGAVRAKLVTSFRGADLTIHVRANAARFTGLFASGDLFLPVSRQFRDRLIALGVPDDRVAVHHSGIDLRRFSFAARRPTDGPTRLLFVGRLTEKKGAAYAIEALALITAEGHDARLTIIGDGPLRTQLRAHGEQLGLADRIVFAGPRMHDDVVQEMQASHVLVAPSVTAKDGDQEGIPNVLKEAMATGMPVVATRHSAIPELVEHGVSGYLAAERDAAGLAALLAELIAHPQRWASLGLAGRRAVEASFDADRLNDELVERYRAALRR